MDQRQPATYPGTPSVSSMLRAATQFGLTREEAWRTFNVALLGPRRDAVVAEYLDEIAGALAQAILAKHRRMLAEQSS